MKKITFFLGSGFSYLLAGIKRQNKFLESVFEKDRKDWVIDTISNKDEKKVVKKYKDIEFLLSYIYHRDQEERDPENHVKNRKLNYKRAIINFRMAMNEYLSEKKDHDLNAQRMFQDLIENLEKNKTDFITTNYDLSLENALNLTGKDAANSYCFLENENNPSSNIKRILKLHGSINWLESRNIRNGEISRGIEEKELNQHIYDNVKNEILNEIIKEKNSVKKDQFENRYYEYKSKIYTPVTIPFYFQKSDWYSQRWSSLFKLRIWKVALDILKETDVIIFIGYGFNPGDYPVTALLNKAKCWNKKIINIGTCEKFHDVGIALNACSGKYLNEFNNGNELIDFIQQSIE